MNLVKGILRDQFRIIALAFLCQFPEMCTLPIGYSVVLIQNSDILLLFPESNNKEQIVQIQIVNYILKNFLCR